jgi:ABC-type branched-subunit amino acid transport system ATPase component
MRPRYVLLDEPAAGLDIDEQDLLARHIRGLRDSGAGVLLVEHNFGFVTGLSSTITVLHQGAVLSTGKPDEISRNPKVVDAYLGVSDDAFFE